MKPDQIRQNIETGLKILSSSVAVPLLLKQAPKILIRVRQKELRIAATRFLFGEFLCHLQRPLIFGPGGV